MGQGLARGTVCGKNGIGREGVDGQSILGTPLTSGSQLFGPAMVGGTSGVKGKGLGYLRPYLVETAHCKRLEMLAKF